MTPEEHDLLRVTARAVECIGYLLHGMYMDSQPRAKARMALREEPVMADLRNALRELSSYSSDDDQADDRGDTST
jgi:hypothetical protein